MKLSRTTLPRFQSHHLKPIIQCDNCSEKRPKPVGKDGTVVVRREIATAKSVRLEVTSLVSFRPLVGRTIEIARE